MVGYLEPLAYNFRIVNELGCPTDYFIRWAQQKQIDIGEAVDEKRSLEIITQFVKEHPLQAGNGVDISPDGNLANSPIISAKAQEILDQVTDGQGSILFRGPSEWEALPPGPDNQVLTTKGIGQNPVWAPGGGGGGGDWYFEPPQASSFTLISSNSGAATLSDDTDVGLLFDVGPLTVNDTNRMAYRSPPSSDWSMTIRFIPTIIDDAGGFGLGFRNSSNGRFLSFYARDTGLRAFLWSDMGSFNSIAIANQTLPSSASRDGVWFSAIKSGGVLTLRYSADGKQWTTWGSISLSTYLGTPDQIGIAGGFAANTFRVFGSVQHFDLM